MNKQQLRDWFIESHPLGEALIHPEPWKDDLVVVAHKEFDSFMQLIDQYAYEYAEMVIGEDEAEDVIDDTGEEYPIEGRYERNELRAEQRNRNKELSSHKEEGDI